MAEDQGDKAAESDKVVAAKPALKLPSAAKIAAARAVRKATGDLGGVAPGTVHGLPEGYVAAKLDPSLDEGRKATLRAKWAAAGWVQLDGLQAVSGYPLGCEVWVKTSKHYEADRAEQAARIAEMGRSGLMISGVS